VEVSWVAGWLEIILRLICPENYNFFIEKAMVRNQKHKQNTANTAAAAPGQFAFREQPFQVDQALHGFSLGPKRENELRVSGVIDGSKEIGYLSLREQQYVPGLSALSKEPIADYYEFAPIESKQEGFISDLPATVTELLEVPSQL
jgi:hypothetical protein